MKSIYGKLIIGYLVSILFSFTVAGYFSVRRNSDELSKIALQELETSSSHIANLLSLIDEDDIEGVLQGYAKSSDIQFCVVGENENIYNNLDYELTSTQQNPIQSKCW